jgi:hypothetical protein
MGQMTRYCSECGQDQLFDQPHEGPGCCPDAPDGDCLEWACTGCGEALFIGIASLAAGASGRVGRTVRRDWPGRVA